MLSVENFVPEGVQFIDFIVVLEWEEVSTLVTRSELGRVEILAVERLDKVTDVVDEKAKGNRLGNVLIVSELVRQVRVHIAGLVVVTLLAREPRNDIVQANCEVSRGVYNVVVGLFAVDDVGQVLEVVVRLPALAMVLGVVSEGRTLDEGMLVLVVGLFGDCLCQVSQHMIGGG